MGTSVTQTHQPGSGMKRIFLFYRFSKGAFWNFIIEQSLKLLTWNSRIVRQHFTPVFVYISVANNKYAVIISVF